MTSIDTVVFDFDSVLAEFILNFRLIERQVRSLASAFFNTTGEDNGMCVFEYLDVMAERIGRMDEAMALEYHSRGRLMITAVEMAAAQKGRLLDTTRPVLSFLQQRKVTVCIISHGATAPVRTLFPDILDFCSVFVPREEVFRVKPHPDHLLTAVERCGSNMHRTIMVTGEGSGIEMGKRAGTLTGAVIAEPPSAGEILEKRPDFVSHDVMSLVKLILK